MPKQLALFSSRQAPVKPSSIKLFEIHRDALVTEDPGGATFRWWLKRWWRAGPYVCWIMLNPSNADAEIDDPTMLRVMEFTRLWGFGGLVVVNIVPYRSSSPKIADAWLRNGKGVDEIIASNTEIVLEHAAGAALRIAAWGNAPSEHWSPTIDWLWARLSGESDQAGPVFHCLGTNADGSPKHPLARGRHRVPAGQQPIAWSPP